MARLLGQAELTVCSSLTLLECDRAFARLLAGGRASPVRVEQARDLLAATLGLHVLSLDERLRAFARELGLALLPA